MAFRILWPTQYGIITQQFRERPEVYRRFGLPGHEGIDFQAPSGSEIYAVADGTVSAVYPDGNNDRQGKPYGNQVRVQHPEGFESIYAHLLQITVVSGQAVKAGELIGLADNTGNSAGDHLHFALKKKGATAAGETDYPHDLVDPTPYLQPFAGGRPEPPEPPAQPSLTAEVNSPEVGYLNVRAAPYTGAALVTRAPNGSALGILDPAELAQAKIGRQGQWLWVRTAEGTVGYVAAWYVRLPGGPAPAPAEIHVVVASPDMPLKVRKGPGTKHAPLVEVADGTVLTALEPHSSVVAKLGQYGQWLNVRTADGVTGYSAAWYLQLREPVVGTSFAFRAQEAPPAERPPGRPDDFRVLWGVGDKSAALLHRVGLVFFDQLARLTPDQVRAILAEAGVRGRHVASWPEQARLLCTGQLEALEELQEKLGRRHQE